MSIAHKNLGLGWVSGTGLKGLNGFCTLSSIKGRSMRQFGLLEARLILLRGQQRRRHGGD